MLNRFAAALLVCAGLCACNQTPQPVAPSYYGTGQKDIRVVDAHYVTTGEGNQVMSGNPVGYIIMRIELTNDFGRDMTPELSHIFLVEPDGTRHQAIDSGSSVFTGISNSLDQLKKDDKRIYTVGFRVASPTTTGSIIYEQ